MSFDQLGLRSELLKAVKANGYSAPTPIQAQAIPYILQGRDVLARAQTGTGKTDAFALPLVEILSQHKSKDRIPRALVLAPTRELALQVGEKIKTYARRVHLRCTVVYGGVRIEPQIDRLRRGIDVLVATPGRLLDLADQRHCNLYGIEFVVFDEADRMLDLGFSEEISAILDLLPAERRTMLFSATYTQEIRNLAGVLLQEPEYVETTPNNTAAEGVTQKVHRVEQSNKRALLIHLIIKGRWNRVLIFARTKHGANTLTEKLTAQRLNAAALHGNKSQSLRNRTLKEFREGKVRILVATDVAARGLDISDLPFVVNYDMPAIPEDYIHRIGRTGRAGESGIAVSLVNSSEEKYLQAIESLLGQKIPVEKVEGFTEGSDVPDYVLYRPNSAASEKKADRTIKKIVAQRNASKKKKAQARGSEQATSRRKAPGASKSGAGRRSQQTPPQGKRRKRK